MKRKITSQQLQTKKFFEKNANNWAKEANLINVINFYGRSRNSSNF